MSSVRALSTDGAHVELEKRAGDGVCVCLAGLMVSGGVDSRATP